MKRRPDTGRVRPYRPAPSDFREVFVLLGWGGGIEEHYRTNWRVIARWIEESGGDDLRAARREHVEAEWAARGHGAPGRLRAKRYVLGRTLTAVKVRGEGE